LLCHIINAIFSTPSLQESLDDIAFLLQHVKDSLPAATALDDNNELLFMDLMVDLARDMDEL